MEDAGLIEDICKDCDQRRKLSICIKALQQKWKILRPISFTINPNESDCECVGRKFYGRNRRIQSQQMYLCPKTIMKFFGFDNTVRSAIQRPFLIAQGSHSTQFRVRIFKNEDPAVVEGQLTGFSLNELRFRRNNGGRYKYTPVYERANNIELVCVVVPIRNRPNFRFERNDFSSSDSYSSDD